MMFKNNIIQRYFLALIAGGALGNFYDRIVYAAVPDFIDLHFYGFHWFVFNVADIFITIGVFCLILVELFFNNKNINEKNYPLISSFLILLFLNSCGTVAEGLGGSKKKRSDEFLVEKKSPLVLPPSFGELPEPEESIISEKKILNIEI